MLGTFKTNKMNGAKEHLETWGLVKPETTTEKFYSEDDLISFAESYNSKLEHYKATTVGLWATDRHDLIDDSKGVMFEITDY